MNFWFNRPSIRRNAIWIVIFMVCLLYAVSSINLLIVGMSALPYVKDLYWVTRTLIYFAVISFGITIFLSVYYMYTMFRTEKRETGEIKQK
jgi:tellurite resistance protein TehA-like permease